MTRIPIRLRLTLAFAGAMALLIGVGAILLYVGVARALDDGVDQTLRGRAGDVAALVTQADNGLGQSGTSRLTESGQAFAQVIDHAGLVIDGTPGLRRRPLVGAAIRAAAATTPQIVDRVGPQGTEGGTARLLVTTALNDQGEVTIVVGMSLADRDDALANLVAFLAIGTPVALLLASLAGYGVAAAALRPVGVMREQADRISGRPGRERLPVPPADDEVRQLSLTLNAMLDRIDAVMEHERAFIADASHELRTPLAILRAELDLAMRGDRTSDDLRAAIASAQEEAARIVRLAEDLLVIARSDDEHVHLAPEPIDARSLVDGVFQRFSTRAASMGREMQAGGAPQIIIADRFRLEQAIGNAVENSLVHGGGPVGLDVTTEGDDVVFTVADTGPGVPEAFITRAFDRFSRPDAGRGGGGTGLGLAIVSAIAQAHGGRATIANRPGGGLAVTIRIPAGGPPTRR